MKQCLVTVELDEIRNIHWNEDIRRERLAAISDLLEENSFIVKSAPHAGPYHLKLAVVEGRLQFDIHGIDGDLLEEMRLPLSPFRSLMKEYFMVCEAYYTAQRQQHPGGLETIDMGRRGLHNDGAELVRERLAEWIEVDSQTARRLFTLICVLNLREFAR